MSDTWQQIETNIAQNKTYPYHELTPEISYALFLYRNYSVYKKYIWFNDNIYFRRIVRIGIGAIVLNEGIKK